MITCLSTYGLVSIVRLLHISLFHQLSARVSEIQLVAEGYKQMGNNYHCSSSCISLHVINRYCSARFLIFMSCVKSN